MNRKARRTAASLLRRNKPIHVWTNTGLFTPDFLSFVKECL